jgi:hypothetical protein
MLRLTKLNLDDLLYLFRQLPEDERAVQAAFGDEFNAEDAAYAALRAPGMHWLILDGPAPVAAGGFTKIRPGVYRTWFCAPESTWAIVGHDLTDLVAGVVRQMLAPDLAHRIETVTLADRSRARDWYTKIGLQYESTLRGYGVNGEDAVMYVALRDTERG